MSADALTRFRIDYATGLAQHLSTRTEGSLTIGDELGRRALVEGISILDICEHHYRVVTELDSSTGHVAVDKAHDEAALQFLLQTLTASDVATRGFLDGTRRYAIQRARADDFAARYDEERIASLTLQRAMLGATELPPRFAVRYEPAVPPLEIGGDWYDVVALPDGRIGIIVGDCVGRGLAAAAVMGQLRSSARALLYTGVGPAQMLDHLDAVAGQIPGARCTTVFAAVLDPSTGRLHVSSAGHLPALLSVSGRTTTLGDTEDKAHSLPLATFPCAPRPEAIHELPAGATLVVFTDGLVERRDIDIDAAIGEVAAQLAAKAEGTSGDVAEHLLAALCPPGGYDDDVAMIVYRQPPPPLHLDVPAAPEQLAEVRSALYAWLRAAGIGSPLADDTVMAANEAFTNSIEHGYRETLGDSRSASLAPRARVTVDAAVDGAEFEVTVSDTGIWKPPAHDSGHRGRGLSMMKSLLDRVRIESGEGGTVVRMRNRAHVSDDHGRVLTMASLSGHTSSPDDLITTAIVTVGNATVLTVSGTVDLATVGHLEQSIDTALATTPSAFVIDLTSVDFLASAGMSTLVATHERLSGTAPFAVVADGPATSRPLMLTGLGAVLSIHPTLPEAVAAVADHQE